MKQEKTSKKPEQTKVNLAKKEIHEFFSDVAKVRKMAQRREYAIFKLR